MQMPGTARAATACDEQDEFRVDRVAIVSCDGADRGGDVAEAVAGHCYGDGSREGLFGGGDEALILGSRGQDRNGRLATPASPPSPGDRSSRGVWSCH